MYPPQGPEDVSVNVKFQRESKILPGVYTVAANPGSHSFFMRAMKRSKNRMPDRLGRIWFCRKGIPR